MHAIAKDTTYQATVKPQITALEDDQ